MIFSMVMPDRVRPCHHHQSYSKSNLSGGKPDTYHWVEPELRAASPALAIEENDKSFYLNVIVLLKITCIFPVISCECEQSARTLRGLNNYMRVLVGKSRFALLHIHYDTTVELDLAVNTYARKKTAWKPSQKNTSPTNHSRRMQLENLL